MDGAVGDCNVASGRSDLADIVAIRSGGSSIRASLCAIFSWLRSEYYCSSYHVPVAHLAAQVEHCQFDCREGDAHRQAQHTLIQVVIVPEYSAFPDPIVLL
jgi:hypothetical protein